MNNISILGSRPSNDTERILYDSMVRVCQIYSPRVCSPLDTANVGEKENNKYELVSEKIRKADLIIGEQTRQSTAQGLEIGLAVQLQKPVWILAQEGTKVSRVVTDCPVIRGVLFYDSMTDLEEKLSRALRDSKID